MAPKKECIVFRVFKRTKELEAKIDEFLDTILQASLEFKQGIRYYLEENFEEFSKRAELVDKLEGKADTLRRDVENKLYAEMLLPEARGDVLALLENSDNVLNIIADTILGFQVERPKIPDFIDKYVFDLVSESTASVEEMVTTVRSYFKNITAVRDHITKIMFHEKESDRVGNRIRMDIFKSKELDLVQKIHISTFIEKLLSIADYAEDVGDRISIYVIKRLD